MTLKEVLACLAAGALMGVLVSWGIERGSSWIGRRRL